MPRKLGELLIEEQLITREQLDEALHLNRSSGIRLGSVLVKMGYVDGGVLTELLSKELGVPLVCGSDVDGASLEAIGKISREFAQKYRVVPFRLERNSISVAMSDPYDIKALDEIGMLTGHVVKRFVAPDIVISKALSKFYRISAEDARYYLVKQKDEVPYHPQTTMFEFDSGTGGLQSVTLTDEFEGFGDPSDASNPMVEENPLAGSGQEGKVPSGKNFIFSSLDSHECAALFNVLERKGLITKEELMDETRILKNSLR